ncbi:MAG: late competence development ComFB family protein [Methylomonas sp.]
MLNISNYYEQLVRDHLWQMIENAEQPLSQTFIEDVACLALNKLPICYVRSQVDKAASLSGKDIQEMSEAVAGAIDEAIEQVSRRPHDAREI